MPPVIPALNLLPKIVYPTGTLLFTYPPVEKPGLQDGTSDELEAQRVDSVTMSGHRQSFYIRTDVYRVLTMNFVPMADMPAWSAFMAYAVTGGPFDYYPDASQGAFTTFTLEDTTWTPKYAFRDMAKFSLKLRLYV